MSTKPTAWEQRRTIAKSKAIELADNGLQNQHLPTYSELVAALRISKHHVNKASDRAYALASVNEHNGMHGTAAEFTKAATESSQAHDLIADLLSRIPS